jgi:hypothetical protein
MNHTITIKGRAARGSTINWDALSALQRSLSDTSRRVLRLRADGRSHLRHPPDWLAAATELDLNLIASSPDKSDGGTGVTRLFVGAPALGEAAPDAFVQLQLFEGNLRRQDTAISLLEESLRVALDGNAHSDWIDRGILGAITTFSSVLDLGFDSISLNGGESPAVEINRPALDRVEKMVVKAPQPRKVVVSGTLDMLQNSRRVFVLRLGNERVIRGFYPPTHSDSIGQQFGRQVVVDGEAVFRPSGDIASILASNIRFAQTSDAIWATVPRAEPRTLDDLKPRVAVANGASAFAKIFGNWPGDESDVEIERVLAAIQ